jgi:hypothetical protein
MLIANPAYDTVFKHLLQNSKLAKFFIGLLLETTIIELEIQPQEVTVSVPHQDNKEAPIAVMRLDFKATIVDENGEHKVVLIELQKSKHEADLFRFRNYLGAQYLDKENSYTDNKGQVPIPIITIYFIGFNLPIHQDVPILMVERSYKDHGTKELLHGKIPFIEVLSHDMILVQMNAIKQRRRFEIEKILSIFDSKGGIYIEVDEANYPTHGREIIDYLHNMMKEPIVVRDLVYEEMLNKEIQEERSMLILKLEEAKAREEEAKIREKEAILNLQREGLSIFKIASIYGISEEVIKSYLSKK